MKILALSDLHGYLPDIPSSDLLIIGGDVTPPYLSFNEEEKWFKDSFSNWLNNIKTDQIILIAGNKDRVLEKSPSLTHNMPLVYLKDSVAHFKGVSFWGSPWSLNRKKDWSFALSEKGLENIYHSIPRDLDFLISHSPPRGVLDSSERKKDMGSEALLSVIKRVEPKILICGHMHDRGLEKEVVKNTTVLNTSLLDLRIKDSEVKIRTAAWMIDWKDRDSFLINKVNF